MRIVNETKQTNASIVLADGATMTAPPSYRFEDMTGVLGNAVRPLKEAREKYFAKQFGNTQKDGEPSPGLATLTNYGSGQISSADPEAAFQQSTIHVPSGCLLGTTHKPTQARTHTHKHERTLEGPPANARLDSLHRWHSIVANTKHDDGTSADDPICLE